MSTFEERQKAEEAKFSRDQELYFLVRNRRNKLFGLWIAREHLRLPADMEAEYAKSIVLADLERPGDEDIIAKVTADLDKAGLSISEHILRRHLESFTAEAREEVMKR
jgi:hypothetical protein